MYEKLTPKEYILEEQSNDEALNIEQKANAITSSSDGAAAVEGCNKKGLFGGGFGGSFGGLFNQIGIEEILIIGLILLLVFEEGEFDMILILGFLLLCGLF